MTTEEVLSLYNDIRQTIIDRIAFFKELWRNSTEEDIFRELAFCLLTPQSKARSADKAIKELLAKNLLFSDDVEAIADVLNIVRFKNHKARYIIEARRQFTTERGIELKKYINENEIINTRNWFFKNVKGIGLKEAGHFLRNIGFGECVAILDRHILKNLKLCGVIDEVPKSLPPKVYYDIEAKMLSFANNIGIPPDHLDFVFWYKEAGEVFK